MSADQVANARHDLLARLGLPADADADDVAEKHSEIVAFLETAPASLGPWVKRRRREVDRIEQLLSGSPEELATRVAVPAASNGRVQKVLWVAIGLLALVGVIVGVYWLGRPQAESAATSTQSPTTAVSPTMNTAALNALMAKVAADPKDVDALLAIYNLYFNAGDFSNALTFANKVLAFEPKNERALLDAGAASYMAGDTSAAEKSWLKVVKLNPKNTEAHYDLGFLYMTTSRPDAMKAEWAKVIELAPNSQLAANVRQHLSTAAPTSSPTS